MTFAMMLCNIAVHADDTTLHSKCDQISDRWQLLVVAINVKIHRSILEEKLSFKMLGLAFSSKLDWTSYIIFISKTASKKIGALIRSIMFLSPEFSATL